MQRKWTKRLKYVESNQYEDRDHPIQTTNGIGKVFGYSIKETFPEINKLSPSA